MRVVGRADLTQQIDVLVRVQSRHLDEAAHMTFDEFARTRLPALLRFAKVLCVDRGTAEDVLQEVLLRVHARWGDIAALDQPDVYVRRMIVNEYLSWRRKWARLVPQASLPDEAGQPDPAGQVADRAQLVAEIGQLPRRQRTVLVMRYFGAMSDAEIAADLDCSQGTVRSHLSRALASLRVQINQQAKVDEADEQLAN